MARVRTTQADVPITTDSMQTIANRIRAKSAVPIIGSQVAHDLALGGHARLALAYVTYCQNRSFKLAPGVLAEMLQFRGIADDAMLDLRYLKEDYINFAKNCLMDTAEAAQVDPNALDDASAKLDSLTIENLSDTLSFPSFDNRTNSLNPFLLLAALDLPIYLTTSSHSFLEMALRSVGKQPQTEICRWRGRGSEARIPPVLIGGYEPSPVQPLVYHLFGYDVDPDSLVLTEDDYLNYLVAVTENFGNERDPVHLRIRQALAESSLVLLGYSLRDWETRTLFRGIVVPRTRLRPDDPTTGVINIQLKPDELEERYLMRYLEKLKLQVEWKEIGEYLRILYSRL